MNLNLDSFLTKKKKKLNVEMKSNTTESFRNAILKKKK